jgi:uncharacterized protein (UPF0333 family)
MSQRSLAIALLVVTVICVAAFVLSFQFDAGNKRALLAVAVGGASTTLAAWLWARRPTRS